MTAYVLLILEAPDDRRSRPEATGQACYDRMMQFTESLQSRGVLRAVESLRTERSRVERSAGKARLVDGPFAEARELVGGFFLIDVATRQQAEAIAGECPAAEWATVELRETGPCYLA
ncbi:MAG TPA: YciI family protein [Solimonas sp.]|nr:YciI family protein [Solimonas sp.]